MCARTYDPRCKHWTLPSQLRDVGCEQPKDKRNSTEAVAHMLANRHRGGQPRAHLDRSGRATTLESDKQGAGGNCSRCLAGCRVLFAKPPCDDFTRQSELLGSLPLVPFRSRLHAMAQPLQSRVAGCPRCNISRTQLCHSRPVRGVHNVVPTRATVASAACQYSNDRAYGPEGDESRLVSCRQARTLTCS